MTISITLNESEAALVSKYAEKSNLSLSEFAHDATTKAARNAAYLAKLDRADAQIRNGQVVVKTMKELEAMAE